MRASLQAATSDATSKRRRLPKKIPTGLCGARIVRDEACHTTGMRRPSHNPDVTAYAGLVQARTVQSAWPVSGVGQCLLVQCSVYLDSRLAPVARFGRYRARIVLRLVPLRTCRLRCRSLISLAPPALRSEARKKARATRRRRCGLASRSAVGRSAQGEDRRPAPARREPRCALACQGPRYEAS